MPTPRPQRVRPARAPLTDEFYRRMIANPDGKIPFQVNWARVSRLPRT